MRKKNQISISAVMERKAMTDGYEMILMVQSLVFPTVTNQISIKLLD
jgi:hypothetical protein